MSGRNHDDLPDFETHREVLRKQLELWHVAMSTKRGVIDEPTMAQARDMVLEFAEHTGVLNRMPAREGQQLLLRFGTDLAYLQEAIDTDDFNKCYTQCFNLH